MKMPSLKNFFPVIFGFLLLLLPACSRNNNPALYGKWQYTGATWYTVSGTTTNVQQMPDPHGKVMEFHSDGTYSDGGRPGKFGFADTNHVNFTIDGLMGTGMIVISGDTLDIWNPDGSTVEHYQRVN